MTDERTKVRAVLEAVSADPPPTRLSVDEICAAARRPRPRPAVAAWLRRLSVPLPPGRLIAQVVAIAAVAALLPGLVLVGFLTSRHGGTSSGAGGGGAGVVPQYKTGTSADGGRAASAGGNSAAAVPPGVHVLELGGIVELSADQRVLSTKVSVGGCHGLLALTAQVLPGRVLLAATENVRGRGTQRPCDAARLVTTLTVRLPQPLGARRVVDRGTGRRLPVLDRSKVAQVTYVPAGYQPNGDCTPPSSAGADAGNPPAVARCSTHYSVDRPGGGGLGLSVTQYLGSRPADRGGPTGPTWAQPAGTHVHGQAAQLRLGHQAGKVPGQVWYTRQLLWTENGVDVTVSSGPADSPDALLSAAEMLRIGDGIHW